VLLDTASQAGLRLVIPSLATPVGGVIAGYVMSRYGRLSELVRIGCLFMILGNALVASLQYHDVKWKYIVYLFPANLGQGIVYPSILFTFLAAFDHSRKLDPLFLITIPNGFSEQAVATSVVYLSRSMGTVWGVAGSSTIVQNILASRLPDALTGVPGKDKVFLSCSVALYFQFLTGLRLWTRSVILLRH